MKDKKTIYAVLVAIVIAGAGLSIAYAAMSTTLTTTFGRVTQNSLTWNVGFDTTSTSVSATAAGTSATGRSCGTATITAGTVTIGDTTLSKPGDKCTWAVTVRNSGQINAKLSSIAGTQPSGNTCSTQTGTMTCGNIKYSVTTDAAGSTVLKSGASVAANQTLAAYIVAEYVPTNAVQSSAITQTGATFKMTWAQS